MPALRESDTRRRYDVTCAACGRELSDAAKCRQNGWTPGTILEGEEGNETARIVVTAIGEGRILARTLSRNGIPTGDKEESNWTLSCRDWKKVGQE